MEFDAFISYSSKDKTIADAACATLEGSGVRCWIAPRDILPGMEYGASIVEAIDRCRVLLLIFSSNANESQQIRREVERAVSRGVPIVPVRIEDVKPTKSMAYFVQSVHWLDAISPPVEAHLHRLATSMKAILAALPELQEARSPLSQATETTERAEAAPPKPALQTRGGPKASGADKQRQSGTGATQVATILAAAAVCVGVGVYAFKALQSPPSPPVGPANHQLAAVVPVAPPPPAAATTRNVNPVDGGMPVSIGDDLQAISAAYQTLQKPAPWGSGKETWLYLKDKGIEFFFADDGRTISSIHFVSPWNGSIHGGKLGDATAQLEARLGDPASVDSRFGGTTTALTYRWPYSLTVEFHVESTTGKVGIIMMD
jgi:hypothetical protein